MTKRHGKNRKIVIFSALGAVCLCAGLAGYHYFLKEGEGAENPVQALNEPTVKPEETDALDRVSLTWKSYETYRLKEVDFTFVIATVHVEAEEATNISLEHFVTDEGIRLSDTEDYVELLEENSLFLGRKNVWFSLIGSKNSYDVNLFIPVKDQSAESMGQSLFSWD